MNLWEERRERRKRAKQQQLNRDESLEGGPWREKGRRLEVGGLRTLRGWRLGASSPSLPSPAYATHWEDGGQLTELKRKVQCEWENNENFLNTE